MKKIQVIAHRAATHPATEHTLAAYDWFVEKGVNFIELDVRQSADGVFFVFRDEDLLRMTGLNRPFHDTDSSLIRTLDTGRDYPEESAHQRIPLLEEVLDRYADKISFYFDVKEGTDDDALISLLKNFKVREDSFFWFEDTDQEWRFYHKYPYMRIKKNVENFSDMDKILRRYRPDIVESGYEKCCGILGDFCRRRSIQLMIHENEFREDDSLIRNPSGISYLNTKEPVKWAEFLS